MKNILAENMRRFNTKNLSEQINSSKYKYFCENPDKTRVGTEEFNSDISEAISLNDVSGIIMIATEFVNWVSDSSVEKGNYHQDSQSGTSYQDRDDAQAISQVPVSKLKQAINRLKSNENDQTAKNVIQNIISSLASYLD